MKAIFKREFKSFFTSMIAPVFIAALVLVTGIYFMVYNLNYGYPYFAYTLRAATIIFVLTIPILTMRSFSEERHSKTDQLLLTSPASIGQIVLGKYFAMVAVVAIPCIIAALCPIIIKTTGQYAYFRVDYSTLFFYFIIGCVYVAIGMLISAMTESVIIAAVGSIITLLLINLASAIASYIPSTAIASLIGCFIILVLIVIVCYLMTASKLAALVTLAAGTAALLIVYFINSDLYENLIPDMIKSLGFVSILDNVATDYVFDVKGLVFLISLAAALIFITTQVIKKRSWTTGFQLKSGSYSMATTAVVLAIIVVANLIIGQLPAKLLSIDISENNIFEVSDTSKEILKDLDKKVTVNVVAETGSVDSRIEKFIDIYKSYANSNLKVEYTDPVLHPDVLTENSISTDSIVVSCDDTNRTQVIDFDDIIVSQSYYYTTYETEFDADGQLTSAIAAVSTDNSKKLYLLSGHGESPLSSEVGELLTKSNMETASLSLLSESKIPEDCDLLIINNPTSDLKETDYTTIHNYLYNGGKILLIRNTTDNDLENLDALMEDYGLTMVNSYIGDRSNYYQLSQSAFYFFPEITSNATNVDSSSYILVGPSAGMLESENMPENVALTTLLTTSSQAFKNGESAEYSQYLLAASSVKSVAEAEEETSEENGSAEDDKASDEVPSSEAVSEEESTEEVSTEEQSTESETTEEESLDADLSDANLDIDNGDWIEEPAAESILTVLTVPSMISSDITSNVSGIENLNEFMNILSSFFDDIQNVSVQAKSLEVQYNTVTNAGLWKLFFLGIVPVFCIVSGFVVWIRRRRR